MKAIFYILILLLSFGSMDTFCSRSKNKKQKKEQMNSKMTFQEESGDDEVLSQEINPLDIDANEAWLALKEQIQAMGDNNINDAILSGMEADFHQQAKSGFNKKK